MDGSDIVLDMELREGVLMYLQWHSSTWRRFHETDMAAALESSSVACAMLLWWLSSHGSRAGLLASSSSDNRIQAGWQVRALSVLLSFRGEERGLEIEDYTDVVRCVGALETKYHMVSMPMEVFFTPRHDHALIARCRARAGPCDRAVAVR